jgi:hypothetical protein
VREEETVAENGLRGIIEFLMVQPVHTAEIGNSRLRADTGTAEKDNGITFLDPVFEGREAVHILPPSPSGVSSPVLILVLASIFVLMGLNLLGILEINYPVLIKKIPQNKANGYFVLPFLIGCVFALASSPCSTPILASLLAFATVSKNIILSLSLFFLFALGQCLVIILFALFASVLKNAQKFARFSSVLMKISGVILIIAGLYIYYRIFSNL